MVLVAAALRGLVRFMFGVAWFMVVGAQPQLPKRKEKDKSPILSQFGDDARFLLFWWCAVLGVIAFAFLLDHVIHRSYGKTTYKWTVKRKLDAAPGREAYWNQFVDPTKWKSTHPIVCSADMAMVRVSREPRTDGAAAPNRSDDDEFVTTLDGVHVSELTKLQPLKPSLGIMMRHKKSTERLGGHLYCTRECTKLEKAGNDDSWGMAMRTVQVGTGFHIKVGTETTELELAPAKKGKITCYMHGEAEATTRFWCWWQGLRRSSIEGAEAYLDAISQEVCGSKKNN